MWFPLVLFGLVILASTPSYGYPTSDTTVTPAFMTPDGVSSPTGTGDAGIRRATGPLKVTAFWLVARPLSYVVTSGFYWLQVRRPGVATSSRAYVLTGLWPIRPVDGDLDDRSVFPGDLTIRGLTPLIAVALGLLFLARAERSWALLAFAVPFLPLTVLVNLYNRRTLCTAWAWARAGPEVSVIVVGSVLLLAGVIFGLAAARTRQLPS